MVIRVVPALPHHIGELLEDIRPDDVQEMNALGLDIEQAVVLSLSNSNIAWTGYVDNVMVCMFGVGKHQHCDIGMPWLFATNAIEKYDKVFLRRCSRYLKEMIKHFPVLVNYVDCRNVNAIKWLKWLGFNFESARPYGAKDMLFHPFWIMK